MLLVADPVSDLGRRFHPVRVCVQATATSAPIGGYSAAEDMVLILDTARFKYPPHWVPLEMLYK